MSGSLPSAEYTFDPAELVSRVQSGSPSGIHDLYLVFSAAVRRFLSRNLGGQDTEDRLHDVFLLVLHSVRTGGLRDPRKLLPFIYAVVRRRVASAVTEISRERQQSGDSGRLDVFATADLDPEQHYIRTERLTCVDEVLSALRPEEREILRRYYMEEQLTPEICGEMKLSINRFHRLRSRAKERFGKLYARVTEQRLNAAYRISASPRESVNPPER